jgi:hypothetical protein
MKEVNAEILAHIQACVGGEPIIDKWELWSILCDNRIYSSSPDRHRWYNLHFSVAKFGDRFIGFQDCSTTGDNGPHEIGWEFEPKSVCEAEAKVVSKTVYVKKEVK